MSLFALAARACPVIACVCIAARFASIRQYDLAAAVLVAGLGFGLLFQASIRPDDPFPPAPA